MRKILILLLAILLIFDNTVPCYAAGESNNSVTRGVFAKFVSEVKWNKIPIEDGNAEVLTDNGHVVSVTNAPCDADVLRVVPIPSAETAAWGWIAGCIGSGFEILSIFDIYFEDAGGNRINANDVNISISSVSDKTMVFSVCTSGSTNKLACRNKNNRIVFSANGSHYYALAKKTETDLDYPVMIGEKGYATFAEAVKDIQKGADEVTITLYEDITVKGQFIGHSYAQKVIIDLNGHKVSSTDKALTVYRSGTEVTIKNGTIYGNTTGGTIQVTYGGKLTLGENVIITSGGHANALKVDANSTLVIAEDSVKVQGGKNDLTVAAGAKVEISAGTFKHPVNDDWCAEGYISCENTDGTYGVRLDVIPVAEVNGVSYETLADALAAAKTGDTVKVMSDIQIDDADVVKTTDNLSVMFKVEGKSITLDLNGKKIDVAYNGTELLYAVVYVANGASLTVTGNGTIDLDQDGKAGSYFNVAYLFWKRGTSGTLTVESGTFHANNLEDSMVYTNGSQKVTINGGTFILDTVGKRTNGSPWIFNAQGRNERHIIVNGGTYNADVNHQYWVFEVQMPKEKALKYDVNTGLWTTVDAVAYVNEQEWSGKWYTHNVGYASIVEAETAVEDVKTQTIGKNVYTSAQECVTVLTEKEADTFRYKAVLRA